MFCNEEIEPEELDEGEFGDNYLFHCTNEYCQAIYQSKHKQPIIHIYHGSNNPDINLLRNEL